EPRWVHEVDGHLACFTLEKAEHVGDRYAAELALQELGNREALAAVVHRDDDLIGLQRVRKLDQATRVSPDSRVFDDLRVTDGRYECHDLKSAAVAAPAQLQKARSALARSVDDHAARERGVIGVAREDRARRREQHEADREAPSPKRARRTERKEEVD